MFIIPSIDLSMKLSLSEVFVSNIIVTMVISNKSCCKHVLFTNLSDFIPTTTRVTSLKSKKFLFCSFSVAKFGIAPKDDSFPLNHGQKDHVHATKCFLLICIQTPQRVVHTKYFLCRFLHWMSLTDILRDREEGEGWSNCSSRLPSHLTLGSSMAITSPQVGA